MQLAQVIAKPIMWIAIDRSPFFPWCQRLQGALCKYNSRNFLTEHDLLSVYQLGFRKKPFFEIAVVYLTNYILEHIDRQMITGAVFIDLKKAFDLVNHEFLLFKQEHYGVRGTVWIGSRTILPHSWKCHVPNTNHLFWRPTGFNFGATSPTEPPARVILQKDTSNDTFRVLNCLI